MAINFVEHNKCVGCGACEQSCPRKCISLKANEEGFLYPIVETDKCTECGLCQKACPVVGDIKKNDFEQFICGWNKSKEFRKVASSGGIFILLAHSILDADGVIYGAAFSNEFSDVEHIRVSSKNELSILCGSKYVQSNINNSYIFVKEDLQNQKKVLFTGTPCQIAGLKSYLNKEYDNLFCVDIVCSGVPSPRLWKKYVDELSSKNTIKSVAFRNKKFSWKYYCFAVQYVNGKKYICEHLINPFMRLFLAGLSIRKSCYECKFRNNFYQSDLSLSDAWGLEPQKDDDSGSSLIVVRTGKGKKMLQDICDSLNIMSWDEGKKQPALLRSVVEPKERADMFLNIEKYSVGALADIYVPITKKERFMRIAQMWMVFLMKRLGVYKIVKIIRYRLWRKQ